MKHLAPEKSTPEKNRELFAKLKTRWHSQIKNRQERARQRRASLLNKGPGIFQKKKRGQSP